MTGTAIAVSPFRVIVEIVLFFFVFFFVFVFLVLL